MIETLTADSFRPFVDGPAKLEVLADRVVRPGPAAAEPIAPGSILEMVVAEVRTTGKEAFRSGFAPERLPFSVLLRGPSQPVLPQRIHRLLLPEQPALELFLVPVGRDAHGVLYEACFT